MSEYSLLSVDSDSAKEKVRQFAKLLKDFNSLDAKKRKLQRVIDRNNDLLEFIWKTKTGEFYSIFDLGDNHLKNIMGLAEAGMGRFNDDVLFNLKEECAKRGFSNDNPELNVGEVE